ncbi:YceD family protein [Yoonia sp.]|uniref:YceD family protein n=1 Tax=Yoonia sp. TaxID=2212373 RepID=UPI003F6B6209
MEAPLATLPRSQLRLADLTTRRATAFTLVPTADERRAIADTLGITGIRKLRFAGQLEPIGRTDWALTADLGATVVQECVVTLAPVTSRIDETVTRSYVADLPEPEGAEVEMPEDDTVEPLPAAIDLAQVMIEALALALPVYPRSEGAEMATAVSAPKGATPLTDDDTKPFAGLGALRDSLENKDD